MGSYSVAQYGLGGVEVASMSPAFSTATQAPMYVMQEPAKGRVFVQAVPAANQTFRPQAQHVNRLYNSSTRPVMTQQPQQVALVRQAPAPAANSIRLVQMPGISVQLQQQPQLVMAPQSNQVQPQPQGDFVCVNVNGVLRQGIMQNGSVYLFADGGATTRGSLAQSQQVQMPPITTQQSMTMSVGHRQAAVPNNHIAQLPNGQVIQQSQQQYVAQQQQQQQVVLPTGARLVQISQAPVRTPVVPPQQLPVQQQTRPVMTVPAGMNAPNNTQQQQPVMVMMQQSANGTMMQSSTPMTMMMVPGCKPAGMQATAAGPQQMHMSGQVAMCATTAASVTAGRPTAVINQPMQAVQATPGLNSAAMAGQQVRPVAVASNTGFNGNVSVARNTVTVGQQAGMQAFRPALAAGAKILVPGTSVSASTASLMSKAMPVATPTQIGAVSAMPTAVDATPVQQVIMPNYHHPFGASTQPMVVPAASSQQQSVSLNGTASAGGELSSPPAPPLTPAAAAAGGDNSSPGALSNLVAMLNKQHSDTSSAPNITNGKVMQMGGGQLLLHGVIGGQRRSKDGLGTSLSATPTATFLAGGSPTSSTPGSQPGTPARSNSGGGLAAESSSAYSLPGSEGAAGAGNKEAVIRLMARSFIEAGIALEQALTMIQPSDRDPLMAAFAAEASGAPLPAAATPKASGNNTTSAVTSTFVKVSSSNGLVGLSGMEVTMHSKAPASGGGEFSLGLSGLAGLSCADDVSTNNTNINMGSWGFSLFSSNAATDLNGSIAGARALGSAEATLPDVAAAPSLQNSVAAAAGTANKDSALAGMLASLNL